MLDLRIIAAGQAMPVFDLPAALGRRGAAKELGAQIDALIAFYDDLAGDCDLEDGHDAEQGDDEDAAAFPEWHTLPAVDHRAGRTTGRFLSGNGNIEDQEQDDEPEDDDSDRCTAGDDHMIAGPVAMREWWNQLGNEIGDTIDGEIERGDDGQAWPEVGAGKQPACMDVEYTDSEDDEDRWVGNFAKDILDGTFAANDL